MDLSLLYGSRHGEDKAPISEKLMLRRKKENTANRGENSRQGWKNVGALCNMPTVLIARTYRPNNKSKIRKSVINKETVAEE